MKFLPTRRLVVVAAALAVLLLAYPKDDVPVLGAVAALTFLLILLAAIDAALSTPARNLLLTRKHPPVVVAGNKATVHWEIHSEAKRSVHLSVADQLAPSLRARARRFSVVVPARGTATVSTVITPMRRGRFDLDTLTLRVLGPLGLGASQREVALATTLRVYPPFRSKEQAELKIKRAKIQQVGLRSAKGRGGGTEFDQLREFSPDDEFRRIDWTASARTGRTIVRTYRAELNQSVLVMLDNGRTMAGRVAGVPRVEHAMDATMMLTAVATRLGDKCGLVAFDREVRATVPPARRTDQVSRVTQAMFALEPELAESDYSGAFSFVISRFRRRTMLVLLTDLVDQAVEASLLPALPLITRTHLVVVAGVRDPQVEAWANGTALDDQQGDPSDVVYRQAAAIASLAERRRTVARLRGVGATVIDAEPSRLASDLADAYLLAKGTGRL